MESPAKVNGSKISARHRQAPAAMYSDCHHDRCALGVRA